MAADVTKRVGVIIDNDVRNTKALKEEEKLLRDIKKATGANAQTGRESAKVNEKSAETIEDQATAQQKSKKETQGIVKEEKKKQKQSNKNTKETKKNVKSIKDSIASFSVTLPLLFGSQSISKGIESAIGPSLELLGVQQVYSQFMALKYLPTAELLLDQVLEFGDNMEEVSAEEGYSLLIGKLTAESVGFTAEIANMGAAIGQIIPGVGASFGALTGAVAGATASANVLGDENLRLMAIFDGVGSVAQVEMVGGLTKLTDWIGITNTKSNALSGELMGLIGDFNAGRISVDEFAAALEGLPPITVSTVLTNLNKDALENLQEFMDEIADTELALTIKPIIEEEKSRRNRKSILQFAGAGAAFGGVLGATGFGIGAIPGAIIGGIIGTIVGVGSNLLGFAEGGVVPGPKGAPVPALVHGGETIIPPGDSAQGNQQIVQNITINASIGSDYDVRRLADQLDRYWSGDVNQMRKNK